MTLIKSATAPTFALPGTLFTGLASPERGSTSNAVWHVRLEPGTQGATHRLTHEEIFVCLEGSGTAAVGSEIHQLAKGDALIVPPDTDLALTNAGATDFCAIAVFPVGGQAKLPGQPAFTPPWAK